MPDKINKLPMPSLDQGSQELTEEYIRLRAYHFFEERGCEHGHDVEDWLRAEAEILGKNEGKIGMAEIVPIRAHKSAAA